MRKTWGILIVATLIAAPSMAQQVTIDYARDFDFEAVKTFEYVDSEQSNAANPLMADRIQQMIRKELVEPPKPSIQATQTFHCPGEQERCTLAFS